MTDQTYNGWTNYETWAVALWIDNEQGSYNYWHDLARTMYEDELENVDGDIGAAAFNARCGLAAALKDQHEEAAEELLTQGHNNATVMSDLLNAALGSVDWYEVARHYVDEYAEAEVDSK